jgi:protoporphyrinogen oxidase
MKQKADVVIIGAGISGCAAAQELQANGIDYLLLEQNVEPGGLTRSISVGDAHFDYTGHYLHLSKYKSPAEIPYAKQNDEDWQIIERKSVVYVEGEIVPAPLQYNLAALPDHVRRACIESYRNRPPMTNTHSLKDYLLSGFGSEICRLFLFPYNEKQIASSLDNFSTEAITRFFPCPDENKIEKGFIEQDTQPTYGYNRNFWYPKNEGIGLLARGLANGLADLHTSCNVERIDIENKRLYSSQGEIEYNRLVSSMSLKGLCLATDDSALQSHAISLKHNRVLCLNLRINSHFHKDFEGCHWIYVPDKSVPFYRVGFYSRFKHSFVSSGKTAMYIEVALGDDEPLPGLNDILDDVFTSLENLGWISGVNCDVIAANWIDCAYIHFNRDRKNTLKQIFDILKTKDIHPIGRYGLWDYISMEDSIFSSVEVAKKLI